MIIDPSVIRQVSREKDIDPEKMFAAPEEAMSSAARKFYRDKAVVTAIDRKSGEMSVTSRRTVVEELDTESEEPPPQILLAEAQDLVRQQGTKGDVRVLRPAGEGEPPAEVSEVALGDEIVQHREPIGLGRIAAQTAKQVLYQKVREAERDNIYNEFFPKVGELMSGTVKRFERGDMIVDLGKSEAIIPRDQQSRAERYGQGERIRSILYDVHRNPKGPQLVLSRTSGSSRWKCRRSTTAPSSSRAPSASRASGPRWPSGPGSATWTRSGPVSACAGAASSRSCGSCTARRSTSSSIPTT